ADAAPDDPRRPPLPARQRARVPGRQEGREVSERVAVMVLARDRAEPLERTLRALERQTRRPDLTLVIDNDGTEDARAVIAAAAGVEVLPLNENLGCAGGFEAGERRLLEDPALDYVIGFDDD